MLSVKENEYLTRIGPGTPMGELVRQYWLPFLPSAELPDRDGRPLRVRLLAENLIAFRDSNGRVGLLAENCAHRGASLFFGRNERAGLRCVYHGWKFGIAGNCLDMPNEPPESNFKEKVHQVAYPCIERGGVIWAYMGPRSEPPPLPNLEWMAMPESRRQLTPVLRECNWVQGLEGDIDTSHLYFLHARLNPDDPPSLGVYHPDKHPRLELVETGYGMMYGARREADPDHWYWRITQFMFPFHTFFPPGGVGGVPGHIWVPIDDDHTLVWTVAWNPDSDAADFATSARWMSLVGEYLPRSSDPLTRWHAKADRSNDYQIDRDLQQTKTFTGLPTIMLQDQAVTESMGAIYDRTQEHLGTTDAMIIQVRRCLMNAAQALREQGVTPPGVAEPELYQIRSASLSLPKSADWVAATKDVVAAFSGLPVAAE